MIAKRNDQILYTSERVTLRRLTCADREEFVALVEKSSEHLYPWVWLPATCDAFDEYIQRFAESPAECILVCAADTEAIVGTVSLTNIVEAPYWRATVGYNSFVAAARRGYMIEAFPLVFKFAFEDLGLHRLEADIQPTNEASLTFAERVGFQYEGFSREFIYIGNEWTDHERWAAINSSWKPAGPGRGSLDG